MSRYATSERLGQCGTCDAYPCDCAHYPERPDTRFVPVWEEGPQAAVASRWRKARALVAAIERRCALGEDIFGVKWSRRKLYDHAVMLLEVAWYMPSATVPTVAELAREAGVRDPSWRTCRLVQHILKERT